MSPAGSSLHCAVGFDPRVKLIDQHWEHTMVGVHEAELTILSVSSCTKAPLKSAPRS